VAAAPDDVASHEQHEVGAGEVAQKGVEVSPLGFDEEARDIRIEDAETVRAIGPSVGARPRALEATHMLSTRARSHRDRPIASVITALRSEP
jgi:hypothetical protein